MEISDITHTDLHDQIIGPMMIEECGKEVSKGMNDEAYMNLISGYRKSIFQNFESYHRTEVVLVEDDIRLLFKFYHLRNTTRHLLF